MLLSQLIKGITSYIPGMLPLFLKGTGGSDSARYCYSIWLRHLVMAHKNGLPTDPQVLAELGPGDSLGVGLCALLCGTQKYYGFDVIEYASIDKNLAILDQLIILLQNREPIPNDKEFPKVRPKLDSYDFPDHILDDKRLALSLTAHRIRGIRQALQEQGSHHDIEIAYFVPWDDSRVIMDNSVDMVITQGVMQLIDDLPRAYQVLARWLKPNGYMSHETDYTSYRVAKLWNGCWAYSDLVWRLIKGKRQNLVNREPHSSHIQLMQDNHFKIVCDNLVEDSNSIKRSELAPRFRDLSDEDLCTSGAFIQAIKLP